MIWPSSQEKGYFQGALIPPQATTWILGHHHPNSFDVKIPNPHHKLLSFIFSHPNLDIQLADGSWPWVVCTWLPPWASKHSLAKLRKHQDHLIPSCHSADIQNPLPALWMTSCYTKSAATSWNVSPFLKESTTPQPPALLLQIVPPR